MHLKTPKGRPLYCEDGKLKVGIHPSVILTRGKSAAETFIPVLSAPASSVRTLQQASPSEMMYMEPHVAIPGKQKK
ncbi:MAG: hypothetical protein IPH84_05930 [Bacteroidales bacterium]|nr:hypothetical protein [Bacteroidales bacterium]